MKIYLPDTLSNNDYVVILDSNTIRVYHSEPLADANVSYSDYYLNSHYLRVDSSETIDSTLTSFVNHDLVTNDYWYRFDLPSILLSFTCVFFIFSSCVLFVVKSFFRGLFK